MKIEFEQDFDYSLKEVLEAREKRFEMVDKIKELKPPRFLKRKETKTFIYTEREFEAANRGVPPAIQKFVTEDLFTMTEKAKFYKKSCRHEFEVEPRQFQDQFVWKGTIQYDEDEGQAYRTIDVTVQVKIPFFGKNMEQTIAKAFKKSLEKDFRTIQQACRLLKKR